MTTTQLILTGITLGICVVIAYGKGYRDGKKDEQREAKIGKRYQRPEIPLRIVKANGSKFMAFVKKEAA
jgi:hypothetical protein